MARRRMLTGQPLLVVSAGAMLTACSHHRTDPPVSGTGPEITGRLCVDADPAFVTVVVNHVLVTEACAEIDGRAGEAVLVEASSMAEEEKVEVLLAPVIEPLKFRLSTEVVPPVGNLMAPGQVEVHADVCVEPVPADARVTLNGVHVERCTSVEGYLGDVVRVSVSAAGFERKVVEVELRAELPPQPITLEPVRSPTRP